MNCAKYEIKEADEGVLVHGIDSFEPKHIFECGQCFRWIKQDDGSYTGVAKGKVVNVSIIDNDILYIKNAKIEEFIGIWFDYFDLGTDYSEIKKKVCKDEIMKTAIDFGYGMRILNQDIREVAVSFIISANNRIPMIMKVVDSICRTYGDKIYYNGREYHTFPELAKLANSGVEQLKVCKGGFRCKYIVNSCMMIEDKVVDIDNLDRMNTEEARKMLTRLDGVGNKVADCILLYSGTKQDVFPADVWVKRVMEELYFRRSCSLNEIQQFASSYFGEYAGYAQQYLFYYARENKIGSKMHELNK